MCFSQAKVDKFLLRESFFNKNSQRSRIALTLFYIRALGELIAMMVGGAKVTLIIPTVLPFP